MADLGGLIDAYLEDEATQRRLAAYYDRTESSKGFTGRFFDQIGRSAGGVDPRPHEITADDIVAVSALSVQVPPGAAHEILVERAAGLTAL